MTTDPSPDDPRPPPKAGVTGEPFDGGKGRGRPAPSRATLGMRFHSDWGPPPAPSPSVRPRRGLERGYSQPRRLSGHLSHSVPPTFMARGRLGEGRRTGVGHLDVTPRSDPHTPHPLGRPLEGRGPRDLVGPVGAGVQGRPKRRPRHTGTRSVSLRDPAS